MEPRKDLIESYKEICREKGAVMPIGPAYYRWFIELNDDDMSELVRLIVFDRADEINAVVFAKPKRSDQDIFAIVERQLHLFVLGFFQFNPDGSVGCYAPLGPEPTSKEAEAIDHRISATRPLVRVVIMRLLKNGASG